ncbi:MAG: hypothetical protein GQ557_02470 [Mycoplasmataceae bacterium]|nr:hypothetical protein [Mycoplasmataceae bacterium]
MNINAERNYDYKKNSQQEERFETTMNYELYFETENKILAIDDWKYKNIKIIANLDLKTNTIFTFSKWNKNIIYLSKLSLFSFTENKNIITAEFSDAILNKDVMLFKSLTLNLANSEKVNIIFHLFSLLKYDATILKLMNLSLNTKTCSLDKILFFMFFKYVGGVDE